MKGEDPSERARLVQDPEARQMVRRVASRIYWRYPRVVTFPELLAIGIQGLAEAARTFDKDRGVPFADFAYGRARGLMMNAVAHEIEQQQLFTGAYRFLEGAVDQGNARRDTQEDQQQALEGFSDSAMAAGVVCSVGQFTQARARGEQTAAAHHATERIKVEVEKALASLPAMEREILQRHYFENEALKDVVAPMGLRNKAAAWSLHGKALLRLGKRLRAAGVKPGLLHELG